MTYTHTARQKCVRDSLCQIIKHKQNSYSFTCFVVCASKAWASRQIVAPGILPTAGHDQQSTHQRQGEHKYRQLGWCRPRQCVAEGVASAKTSGSRPCHTSHNALHHRGFLSTVPGSRAAKNSFNSTAATCVALCDISWTDIRCLEERATV